jgi:hypothetical protein
MRPNAPNTKFCPTPDNFTRKLYLELVVNGLHAISYADYAN